MRNPLHCVVDCVLISDRDSLFFVHLRFCPVLTPGGVWTANYFMAVQNSKTFSLMTVLQGPVCPPLVVDPHLSVTPLQC